MINFKVFVKTQRIMWLKRLLYGERKTGWKMYFDYCFAPVGGKLIFLCDYETSKLSLKSPCTILPGSCKGLAGYDKM